MASTPTIATQAAAADMVSNALDELAVALAIRVASMKPSDCADTPQALRKTLAEAFARAELRTKIAADDPEQAREIAWKRLNSSFHNIGRMVLAESWG